MANSEIIEVPVVDIEVDTPYFTGPITALALKRPLYDLMIGNLKGVRPAECPDVEWKPKEKVVE